ncbi:TPA: hypothetical protein ACHSON_002201 [Raoultella planticola ATCC 33531]
MDSKRSVVLQTILGASLVVVGAIPYAYGGAALLAAGAGMTAGQITQMLSSQSVGMPCNQSAENKASYAFSGVTNIAGQGNSVPPCSVASAGRR